MTFQRNRPFSRPFRLLAVLLLLFACNFPTTQAPVEPAVPAPVPTRTPVPLPSAAPTLPTLTPTPAYQPSFEPAACAFDVPTGYSPECGYLVVPENRAVAGGPQIRLSVAVFRSTAEGPSPDPLVHLSGGPGSSSLDVAAYLFGAGLNAVLERRDFIFIDQRGTGHSQPRLDCPERDALTPALMDGSLLGDAALNATVDSFRRCRDRLVAQGIDLAAYNSAASAADLNDLRIALGYDRLDLYGDSYGTRLALTMLRDYPQAVRSVVLDSTYPLEVNLYTALAPDAQRAFDVLFDDCAADPVCSASYPDLRTVFYGLVDQLNASPAPVSLSLGGAKYSVLLTGDLLMDVLFTGLYNPAVTAGMPRMIFQVRSGDYSILRERLALYFGPSSGLGMTISVQCAEEVPFNTIEDAFSAAQGLDPRIAAFFPKSVRYLFDVCSNWTAVPPDPRENQPVTSDIPALVLAGEFDPITPPAWGQMTAAHLAHSYFYQFQGNGHWVTRSSPCALAIMLGFLDDPASNPDLACLKSQEGMHFQP